MKNDFDIVVHILIHVPKLIDVYLSRILRLPQWLTMEEEADYLQDSCYWLEIFGL
jgi:hypothetical protein